MVASDGDDEAVMAGDNKGSPPSSDHLHGSSAELALKAFNCLVVEDETVCAGEFYDRPKLVKQVNDLWRNAPFFGSFSGMPRPGQSV